MHAHPEHLIPHEPSKRPNSQRKRKLIFGRRWFIQVSDHERVQDKCGALNPGPKALLTMLNQAKSLNLWYQETLMDRTLGQG
jgi:hypothetical protein